MSILKSLAFVTFVLATAGTARASEALAGYLSFGYGRGGTSLSSLTGEQDYRIQAGDGLFLTGGALIPVSPTVPHRFEAQVGFGYLFQEDSHQDDSRVSWSRIPVEALYFYKHTQNLFRLGWGITAHFNPTLSAKGDNSSAESKADTAVGWVLAAEKSMLAPRAKTEWSVGIRWISMDYKLKNFDRKADGDACFLTVTMSNLSTD